MEAGSVYGYSTKSTEMLCNICTDQKAYNSLRVHPAFSIFPFHSRLPAHKATHIQGGSYLLSYNSLEAHTLRDMPEVCFLGDSEPTQANDWH